MLWTSRQLRKKIKELETELSLSREEIERNFADSDWMSRRIINLREENEKLRKAPVEIRMVSPVEVYIGERRFRKLNR